jgi:hypothetical protein
MSFLVKGVFLCFSVLSALLLQGPQPESQSSLPEFGRDTVLVWQSENQGDTHKFVVRIAEFRPNRFLEWENETTQGTVFMSQKAVTTGRVLLNSRLFEAGVDTKGRDATTLWLSRKAFSELKENGRVKLAVDAIDCWVSAAGEGTLSVEVNRAPQLLPVLKTRDDRGAERWLLNSVENPLVVRTAVRKYTDTLISITTDRANTLRWIKGKKLATPR